MAGPATRNPKRRKLNPEERAEKNRFDAERRLKKAIGQEVTGATAMLITLRYLMDGGYSFFGHHGGAIMPFFECLYTDRGFNEFYVHVPHEQIAGHAAEGFAASTGKVGVAVVTSGPGITNLTTACYDAMMDSVPVVYIAGNVSRAVAGSMAFQEAPVSELFRPISKKVFYVTNAADIPSVLFEAFRMAKSGRPGPVVVDVPRDVQFQSVKFGLETGLESKVEEEASFDKTALIELAQKIASAKQPVLCVGGGVKSAEAREEVWQFVAKTGILVTYTLKGKGVFPDASEFSMGPLGMHGSYAANMAVDKADLLIAVGARFDDRVATNSRLFAPNAYIAHLDIDPKGIGPEGARQPQLVIKGDVKASLRALNDMVGASPDLRQWYVQIKKWREEYPFSYSQEGDVIKPQFVIQTLSDLLKDEGENVIAVTDVGQHQMWAMQYLQASNPRGFLSSGGSGTMGYGLPAAFGAKLGNPEKRVVLVTGDASFRMTSQALELYTLYAQKGLDVKVVVIDNSSPGTSGGMVGQWMRRSGVRVNLKRGRGEEHEYASIASITAGYRVQVHTAKVPYEVQPSIALALKLPGPQLVYVKVDPSEDVYPFIPPGGSVKDTVFGPAESRTGPLPRGLT